MSKKVFASIKRGLEEAIDYERGRAVAVRKRAVRVPARVDVRAIRQRMGMTQRAFSDRFGFPLETLKNWERGHRRPEGAARALLTVIDKRPDAVLDALGS